MGRDLIERWRVTGTIIARTAIHIGGIAGDPDTDLPLARDGANRWCVPGTSLAGAFRAWWQEAFEAEETRRLWGWVPGKNDKQDEGKKDDGKKDEGKKDEGKKDEGKKDDGRASFILIDDAPLTVPGGAVELRDGVGIDRRYGAAADRIKHDRAVLPAGTTLPLSLTLDVEPVAHRAAVEAMLAHFLDALVAGDIALGAARTRGLGRVRLLDEGLTIRRQGLKDRAGILATLRSGGTTVKRTALGRTAAVPATGKRLRLALEWKPLGPVMSRAAQDGFAVDILPLLGRRGTGIGPLLTGAGIKGVLRSHAERIVRTLIQAPAAGDHFLEQVRVPLVRALFGDPGDDENPRLGRGALAVEDCYAQWTTDEEGRRTMLVEGTANGWRPTHHVAIDRWTGGAADGLLFSVLEPPVMTWEPIVIDLDFARLDDGDRLPAVTLLLLVLDDLAAGRLPLGFAGNRGMGAVTVEKIAGAGAPARRQEGSTDPAFAAAAILSGLIGKTVGQEWGGILRLLSDDQRRELGDAWQKWIDGQSVGTEAP